MYIIDKNGLPIAVTDLDGALKQAEVFASYFHEDGAFAEFDQKQKEYWLDILLQLSRLKNEQPNNIKH